MMLYNRGILFYTIKHVRNASLAPLPKEVEDRVKERIGCDVKQGWGMSELSPIGTCLN